MALGLFFSIEGSLLIQQIWMKMEDKIDNWFTEEWMLEVDIKINFMILWSFVYFINQ